MLKPDELYALALDMRVAYLQSQIERLGRDRWLGRTRANERTLRAYLSGARSVPYYVLRLADLESHP